MLVGSLLSNKCFIFYAINLIKMKVPLCASIGGTSRAGRFITFSAYSSLALVQFSKIRAVIGRYLIPSDARFLQLGAILVWGKSGVWNSFYRGLLQSWLQGLS